MNLPKIQRKERMRIDHFLFYDYTGIEHHLEAMAQRGWLLKKCGAFFWHYEAIPPQKIHFAVTYVPSLSSYDPVPGEKQELYCQLCQSAGWSLAAGYKEMLIFSSRDKDPLPLETDPVVRLDTISSTMKKSRFPVWILALLLCFQIFFYSASDILQYPVRFFSSPSQMMEPLLYLLIMLIVLSEMIPYFLWLHRSTSAVAAGEDCPPSSRSNVFRMLIRLYILLAASGIILTFAFQTNARPLGVVLILGCIGLGVFFTGIVREDLRERGASRRKNQAITGITYVVTFLLVTAFATFMVIAFSLFADINASVAEDSGYIRDSEGNLTHYVGMRHDILPLTAEDLTDTKDFPYYSYENRSQSTPFVSYSEMSQMALDHLEDDPPELYYEITDVKWPALYEMCLDQFLKDKYMPDMQQTWQPVSAGDWSCSDAWRRYSEAEPDNTWLLAGKDPEDGHRRIVKITFYWTPTAEQIETAGEKLFP